MPLTLTRDSILRNLQNRSGAMSHLTNPESTFSRAGETSLSAFGFGVMQGRAKKIGGLTAFAVPLDAVIGASLHVVGGTNWFGRTTSSHLHNIGDGALASAFATAGYRMGETWKETGSIKSGLKTILGTKRA